ncbi:MAG: hypothetical protein LBI02_11260 [Opitutaceae bacterium]|nr:hypothetical protein [Opitutaceae bacterium]
MAVQLIDLKCSGCGSALAPSQSFCEYCGNAVVVTSLGDFAGRPLSDIAKLAKALEKDAATAEGDEAAQINLTLAHAYLEKRDYEKALQKYDALRDDMLADAYYGSAIALLKGQKPFIAPLLDIKQIIGRLETAFRIENKGVYKLLLAYIKLDFHARRCLRVSPGWDEEFGEALANNLSPADAASLFQILGVQQPSALAF